MKTFSLILLCCMSAALLVLPLERECVGTENEPQTVRQQQVQSCGRCPSQADCQAGCPMDQPQPSLVSYPARACGSVISGFFAFGCKVNYQLTNWILSDKCRVAPAEREELR